MRKCIKERKEEEDQHLEIRTALLSLKIFLFLQCFEIWLWLELSQFLEIKMKKGKTSLATREWFKVSRQNQHH